ncbi:hypothetical protein [Thalassotalea crassostreae]|uniref:hypothetical protein n=1 Tax=Thalassotalea crassostreae TaxID=1763536 RepID=UPI000839579D|nr:hypothetical protein [Thalassotalea crassostreae]
MFKTICSSLIILAFLAFQNLSFAATINAETEDTPAYKKIKWLNVGKAKLEILFFDIYKAQLYTEDGTFSGIKGPLKLHLTYYLDIDGEELVDETKNQWQEMGIYDVADKPWLEQLRLVFPDIKEDDSLTLILDKNSQGLLEHNNKLIHVFEGSEQLSKFFSIWLSKDSTRPELMRKLTKTAVAKN